MPIIRALSIRQPWAWLIVNGHKDVENRKWTTAYRGQILIHTGKSWASPAARGWGEEAAAALGVALPERYELGGFVGVATLVDVVQDHDSPWFGGPYGWVLQDARPLPFSAAAGKLGLYNIEVADGWLRSQPGAVVTTDGAKRMPGQRSG